MPSSPTVVSLLPWLTDLVSDLSLTSHLVAISHDCDADLRILPRATTSRLCLSSTSAACGRNSGTADVLSSETASIWSAAVASATPVCSALPSAPALLAARLCAYYNVIPSILTSSSPDLILTEVLSQSSPLDPEPSTVVSAASYLLPSSKILSLSITTSNEAFAAAMTIARALRRPEMAPKAIARCRSRLLGVASRAPKGPVRLRAAVVQWDSPLYVAGAWVPEVIETAGMQAAFVRAGGPAVQVGVEQMLRGVDLIVVAVCAVDREGAWAIANRWWKENEELIFRLQWRGRVVVANAMRLFSRASLGVIADTAEVLEEIACGCALRRKDQESREVAWAEFRVGKALVNPTFVGSFEGGASEVTKAKEGEMNRGCCKGGSPSVDMALAAVGK